MAAFARIQDTATEGRRPPANAQHTPAPFGREVRTLLKVVLSGTSGTWQSGPAREGHQSSYDALAAGWVAGDDQHRVVSGDGAEDVAEVGLVERGGEEVRRAGRGAE